MIKILNTGVYQGSLKNKEMVEFQIAKRWGKKEVEKYNPRKNCFTYLTWQKKGYQIKKGEKALKSVTWIRKQVIDDETNKVTRTFSFPKVINLFYKKQVKKVKVN